MEKELHYLGMALSSPPRPFVGLLGGAKVSDKIEVVRSLLSKVDRLLIGGGMAYTFLRAKGLPTAKSLVEEDKIELARELLAEGGEKLALPRDHVVASRFEASAETKVLPVEEIPDGWMGLDIGPETVAAYGEDIQKAKLVVWNGPMGVFEMEPFAKGTVAIAKMVADSEAVSIVGGGDSVAAVQPRGRRLRHHPHLDRWRSVPRVPRGREASGSRGSDRCVDPSSLETGRCTCGVGEASALARRVVDASRGFDDVDVVLMPPFTALATVGAATPEARSASEPRTCTGRRRAPSRERFLPRC